MGGGGIIRSHERSDDDDRCYVRSQPVRLALSDATPEQIKEELEKRERNRQTTVYNDTIYQQMSDLKAKIAELSNMIKPLER